MAPKTRKPIRTKRRTGSKGQIGAAWLLLILGVIAVVAIFTYKRLVAKKQGEVFPKHQILKGKQNSANERQDYSVKDRKQLDELIKKSVKSK